MYFQSVILFWTTFVTFSHCHSIANQFYGGEGGFGGMGSSEEMYSGLGGGPPSPPEAYFQPHQEFNSGPPRGIYSRPNQGFYPGLSQGIFSGQNQGFYPEPHQRNLMHHLPPGPSMYEDMPLAHNQLNIAPAERFQNQGLFSHPHYFNPEIMGGIQKFENPFQTMMDPMRKQMSDSIKGVGDNMGKQADEMTKQMENVGNQMSETGKKAMDTMQKPTEELGKEMEEAMENAQDEFGKQIQAAREGAEGVGTGKVPFAPTSNSSVSDGKKKLEGLDSKKDDSGEEMADAKKNAQDAAGDAAKKMQDTGNKLRKSFPIPTAPILGRIKDETTEAHDYESEFPRAEAMEWGSPDFVDVRHHPRSQFYDYYYDGGY